MKITKKNKSLVFTSNSKLTILINTLKTLVYNYNKFNKNVVHKNVHSKKCADSFYWSNGYYISAFKDKVHLGDNDSEVVFTENEFKEIIDKWKLNSI